MATDRGEYSFRVKEDGKNRPWLAAEPAGEELTWLGIGQNLGFELRPGTSYGEALKLAALMNRCVSAVIVWS